jgi:putative phage-type endonuclease
MTAAQPIGDSAPYLIVCDTDDQEEWLSHRDTGIGASEIAGVLELPGIQHRASPLKLFMQKSGALERDDLSEVEAVEWGHTMEPVIASVYARRTGRPVVTGRRGRFQVLRSKEHPWAMCSLDYWTADNDDGAELRPLEIKNVSAFMAEDWLEGPPDYYYAQVMQQLLVTGAKKATSALCLGGNRLLWCDVNRDEEMIRKIVYHGSRFWQRFLDRDPPPPDDSLATKEALARLYPKDDGSVVVMPATLIDTVYDWRRLKEEKSETEKKIRHAEAAIKATLGEAERGVWPSGEAVSWRTQKTRAHQVAESTFRVLRFHESKR